MAPEAIVSGEVIGASIEVHRKLGPGLLESAYETCLAHEMMLRRIGFVRQLFLPVEYKGLKVDNAFRIDFLVENLVLVEIKAVEKVIPIHMIQIRTYLKLSGIKLGLLINFHDRMLRDGIQRIVNGL